MKEYTVQGKDAKYIINIDVSAEKMIGTIELADGQKVTVPVTIQDGIDLKNVGRGASIGYVSVGYQCGIREDD